MARRGATRPRRVEGGIQINSTRGAVARTWWSERFIQVVESLGVGGRLARGRSYARSGQIVSVRVEAGAARRDRPGQCRPAVPGAHRRARVRQVRVGGGHGRRSPTTPTTPPPSSTARCPARSRGLFAAHGLALFPAAARDLTMDCTCPDVEVPCKHLAAVFYLLAERFDADPFEVLALRGRDRETLLADLRARRAAASPPEQASGAAPLAEVLDRFFTGGEPERLAGPATPSDALLDQVPEFPISVRGRPVTDMLRPAYRALGYEDTRA